MSEASTQQQNRRHTVLYAINIEFFFHWNPSHPRFRKRLFIFWPWIYQIFPQGSIAMYSFTYSKNIFFFSLASLTWVIVCWSKCFCLYWILKNFGFNSFRLRIFFFFCRRCRFIQFEHIFRPKLWHKLSLLESIHRLRKCWRRRKRFSLLSTSQSMATCRLPECLSTVL